MKIINLISQLSENVSTVQYCSLSGGLKELHVANGFTLEHHSEL